jgi:hypothetical protein
MFPAKRGLKYGGLCFLVFSVALICAAQAAYPLTTWFAKYKLRL